MITTREARHAAKTWLREEAAKHPDFVGAVLAGSTTQRNPSEPHPASSDVDLFLYVDAEVPSDIVAPRNRFAPRKLAFRGVVLEPSFHNAQILADPEAVLGDMHLAPLFNSPHILLDPFGKLEALAAEVTPEYRRRRHAERRLGQVLEMATPSVPPFGVPDTPAIRAPCWRNAAFCFGVMRCAQAVLISGLRYPTTRRSFIVAREVLATIGRADLADELLGLLGSFGLARTEVEALAAEAERTYDLAMAVQHTPVPMEWNISPDARELERRAVRDLIDAGHHREALLQLLLVRTVAQGIIENDGDEAAKAASRPGYHRLLSALAIDDGDALAARAQAIRAFLPCLREACETVMERTPGIRDD